MKLHCSDLLFTQSTTKHIKLVINLQRTGNLTCRFPPSFLAYFWLAKFDDTLLPYTRRIAANPLLAPRVISAFRPTTPRRTFAAVSSHIPLVAATGMTKPQQSHKNFDLVEHVDLHYAPGMSVEKWKSRVTGLTVYWANFSIT
jgi:hypothetical protein